MGEDVFTEMHHFPPVERKKIKIHINGNLIMLKVSLFFLYGATSSLMPYLTIHMQSIGIKMEEIALIYLALPFTTFLAPPVTGYLVDKFGKYKSVVIVSFMATAFLHHSLLLIPHQETPGSVPSGYVITHPKKLYVEVWWSPCPSRECPAEEELDVVLDMCVDHCLLKKKKKKNETITLNGDTDTDDLTFHLAKKNSNGTIKGNGTVAQFTLDMHENLGDPIEQFGMYLDSSEDDKVMELKKRFTPNLLRRFGVNVPELDERDLRCGGVVLSANVSTQVRLKNYSNDCILQKCNFRSGGPDVCPPEFNKSEPNIFWIYFILRFMANTMMTAGVTIMDPIALNMIERYGGDFGKEKLFSSLGMALFSPITGILIDINSEKLGYTDYSPAFYAHDALLMISATAVFLMPLGDQLPADNVFKNLRFVLTIPSIAMFIIALCILGNLWGFIESFLFFYLRDLGAPNYLLGITVTVGTLSSLPFLYGANRITKRVGHINIVIMAFFAHALRLVGYSVIESAWWCFPFEALESISVHLMWVAAATYCAIIAPKNLLATLIGILGMAHFSIGRGSGSFLGGYIIGKVGIRQAFQLMGLMSVVCGVLYVIVHYVCLAKIEFDTDRDDEEKNGEMSKINTETSEPKFKDQSTMVSHERLSLMIEYNQIGSVSSLGKSREYSLGIEKNSFRRGSYTVDTRARGSASKVDLLRSAVEINMKKSSSKNLSRHTVITNSTKVIPEGIPVPVDDTTEFYYNRIKSPSIIINQDMARS
ncbi:uncharacterized protein LOC123321737 [Coccinella septempunctata]|uniref:uncharacterized protein LOC123321737 n=1 Tax=Coccinella septempunctata TaxID=41139 RepID=UPI001D0935CF|nr:uncharacterized protein LOC123321737 [Coccinella septempunctata]